MHTSYVLCILCVHTYCILYAYTISDKHDKSRLHSVFLSPKRPHRAKQIPRVCIMSLFIAQAVLRDIPLRERTLDLLRESAVAEGCESVRFDHDLGSESLTIQVPISVPEDYTVVSYWAEEAIWHGLTNDDFDEDSVPPPPTLSTTTDYCSTAPEAGGLSAAAGGLSLAAGGLSPAAEEHCSPAAEAGGLSPAAGDLSPTAEDSVQQKQDTKAESLQKTSPLNALQQAQMVAGWGETVLSKLSLRHNPTRNGKIWVGLQVGCIKAVNSNREINVDGHFTLARLPAADWTKEFKQLEVQAVCWDRPACKALCAKYSLNEVYSKSDYALLDILVQESPLQGSLFSLLKNQLGGKVAARDLRNAFHLSLATRDGFRPEHDIPEDV